MPIDGGAADIDAANERMGEKGLRVLAFAARFVDDERARRDDRRPDVARPRPRVRRHGRDHRPAAAAAKAAVQTALGAGIDVRMITGDHAVTAQAIGETLGLGPGAISGSELQAMTDEELAGRLPELHVFGRVSPQDKLRLARLMQEQGLIVAMTGDAVNDAAALKQADIGVAMGSGSEVTKQAGRMILTDDNFGTLVNAVEIGRRVYEKVVSYVRYQMTQLLSLVLLFVAATAFDINQGVALTPLMVLYLLVFMTASGVVVIAVDPGAPDVMHRPPRDPKVPITNRAAIMLWVVYAVTLFVAALFPLVAGPDDPKTDVPTASLTMTFVVMGLGTVFNALDQPARPASGLASPLLKALGISLVPAGDDRPRDRAARAAEGPAHRPRSPARVAAPASGSPLLLPLVVETSKWLRGAGSAHGAGAGRRAARARARPSLTEVTHEQEGQAARRRSSTRTPNDKMERKEYEREMRRLHGELVALQEWVKAHGRQDLHRLRGPRHRRQGRHDQADHRAGQPPRVPGRRAARTDRAREVADVRPALHPALPCRRRGRDLRPQLVQPRRRRARDGLLHRGADASGSSSRSRRSSGRWSTPGSSCSSTGSRSARRSRRGGSRAASTTRARSGSSPTWT